MPQPTDQSRTLPLTLSIALGVLAAGASVGLWLGLYWLSRSGYGPAILEWLAAPATGVVIGLAMHLRPSRTALRPVALALTIIACLVGYFLVAFYIITSWTLPPTLGNIWTYFMGDVAAWLLIAIGAYLAWVLTPRRY